MRTQTGDVARVLLFITLFPVVDGAFRYPPRSRARDNDDTWLTCVAFRVKFRESRVGGRRGFRRVWLGCGGNREKSPAASPSSMSSFRSASRVHEDNRGMSSPGAAGAPAIVACLVHGCDFAAVREDRLTALAAHYSMTHPHLAVVRCCNGAGVACLLSAPHSLLQRGCFTGFFSGDRGCRASLPPSSLAAAVAPDSPFTSGLLRGRSAAAEGGEEG